MAADGARAAGNYQRQRNIKKERGIAENGSVSGDFGEVGAVVNVKAKEEIYYLS